MYAYINHCIIMINTWVIQLTQLMEKKTEQEELSLLENIKISNFIIKYLNPILINGIIGITNSMPDDPIDYLVSHYSLSYFHLC